MTTNRDTSEAGDRAASSSGLSWALAVLVVAVIIAGAMVLAKGMRGLDATAGRQDVGAKPGGAVGPAAAERIPIETDVWPVDDEGDDTTMGAPDGEGDAMPAEETPGMLGIPTDPFLPEGTTRLTEIPSAVPTWPGAEMTLGWLTEDENVIQQMAVLSIRDAAAGEVIAFYQNELVARGYEPTEGVEPEYLTFTGHGQDITLRNPLQDGDRVLLAVFVTQSKGASASDAATEDRQP